MSLQYLNKDITTVAMGIVAHGVNCQHKMASGVAKAIKEKWPVVYEEFMKAPSGKVVLGTAHIIPVDPGREDLFVANCYTQLFYGYGGGKYADLQSVEQSLGHVFKTAALIGLPIYIPRIGCGLGGLDWETEVKPIVERYVTIYENVNIYVCECIPNKEITDDKFNIKR